MVSLTQYYTATSIDGFIADGDNSLDWLFEIESKPDQFTAFSAGVGAFAMGVHAQATPDTQPKMNPNVISGTESKATGADAKAQADANYKAAREACQ